ncbi:unnamed protein product [Gadus morhua 'NCC']
MDSAGTHILLELGIEMVPVVKDVTYSQASALCSSQGQESLSKRHTMSISLLPPAQSPRDEPTIRARKI